jgi:hypothetical protein
MIQPQDDETNWFASWFSSTHKSGSNHNNNDLPFSRKPTKSGIWNATIFSEGLLVPLNDVDLAFYIAAMPYQELPWTNSAGYPSTSMVNYTLLHCRLVNSTSETTFNFTNGLQAISSEITYVKAASTVQSVHTTCSNVTISGKDRRISGYNCHASDRACFYNPDFFQTLSYQAIMDAFTGRLLAVLRSLSLPNPLIRRM